MIIGKQFKFDAAHYLPYYQGKCNNMHGHTWTVDIELEGPVGEDTGMVIDFVKVKELMDPILERLDHAELNSFIDNPTCETLVSWIWADLSYSLAIKFPCKSLETKDNYPQVYSVKIQEGTGGWACLKK